jgi:hypothetical protein
MSYPYVYIKPISVRQQVYATVAKVAQSRYVSNTGGGGNGLTK